MGPFRYSRIKPLAFEYDWLRCLYTMEFELIYFINYAIIVHRLLVMRNYSRRKYSGFGGP
jgi:hypothetical protein